MSLTDRPAAADSEPLPCIRLDTTSVPPDEQFALYANYMPGYAVAPLGNGPGFVARMSYWRIGPMMVTPGRIDPLRVERSERQIRLDGLDHYNFFLLAEGGWEGQFGRRRMSVPPGNIHVLDLTQPLSLTTPGTYTVVVQFPRALIDEVVVPFDMHGQVIPGAAGRLAVDFILALVGRLPDFTRADAQSLVRSTRAVLAAGLAAIPQRAAVPTMAALIASAKRHIRGNLSTDLSPEALARRLGTSRSTLYRAFEPLGGVETFVREQRLARAHEMLANPQRRRSITEIAFDVGFASSAHFSRVFRSRYGYTPGETQKLDAFPLDEFQDHAETEELERYKAWKERLR